MSFVESEQAVAKTSCVVVFDLMNDLSLSIYDAPLATLFIHIVAADVYFGILSVGEFIGDIIHGFDHNLTGRIFVSVLICFLILVRYRYLCEASNRSDKEEEEEECYPVHIIFS